MADVKISALAALTGANTATDDLYVVVDTNVPETKKQTRAEFFQNVPDIGVSGTFVHNDAGADKDARFEGVGDPVLLFTDASTDRVGVGISTPVAKFQVNGSFATSAPIGIVANYSVPITAYSIIVATASAVTLTLPDAATSAGRHLWIRNFGGSGTASAVTSATSNIVPRASGGTSPTTAILPATAGSWVLLICDGTNWQSTAGS
jgi:hypothetical protein